MKPAPRCGSRSASMPIEIDDLERRISHLEIERQALNREETMWLRRTACAHVENELERLRGEGGRPQGALDPREDRHQRVQQLKEELEQTRAEEEKATRAGDWEKAAQLRYGKLAEIERDIRRPITSWKRSNPASLCSKKRSTRKISPRSSPSGPAFRLRACSKAKCRS